MPPLTESEWLVNYQGFNGEPLWLWTVAAAVFGACIGSFLNVCIWRMPRHESVVSTPSHCPSCDHQLAWYENIPFLSYLALRGRCGSCHQSITIRYIGVEFLTMVLVIGLFFAVGYSLRPPSAIAPGIILIMLAVITFFTDIEHRIIPNSATFPAMFLGVALGWIFPQNWGMQQHLMGLIASASSLVLIYLFMKTFATLTRKALKQEALGQGDVKFLAALAALCGPFAVLFVLFCASISGGIYGVLASLLGKRPMTQSAIAFGPFLAFFALIWVYFNSWLILWYYNLLSAST